MNTILVNNTGVDLRKSGIEKSILESIKNEKPLNEEIADLFKMTKVDENRYVVEFA